MEFGFIPTFGAHQSQYVDLFQVMIGNVHYECSCVLYQDDDDLDLGMIIGVCIVVFIVTLFVIFLIFVLVECVFCGRRQAKSVEPDDQNL